jgi:hypothetical protein
MQELCPNQGEGPPVPPQGLVGQWLCDDGYPWDPSEHVTVTITTNRLRNVAAKAAAWGYQEAMATITEREQAAADAELEACCQWLNSKDFRRLSAAFRAARRPKPPSLREQALEAISRLCASVIHDDLKDDAAIVRRALEQLPD